MTVQHIVNDHLCMQCGTCAGTCPKDAIEMRWSLSEGWLPHVLSERCDDCDDCLAVCPARGVDYAPGAWWRGRNKGAPTLDFLGPWRGLWFGWAADESTRYAGASGGVATAVISVLKPVRNIHRMGKNIPRATAQTTIASSQRTCPMRLTADPPGCAPPRA